MSLWPQYAYLAICLFALGGAAEAHGKPQGPFNGWAVLIMVVIDCGLLYAGGFFKGLL